jgi:hypothetical protein
MRILNYSHTSRLTRPLLTSLWLGTPSPSIVGNTRPIRLFRTTLLSLSVCPLVVVLPRLHALRSDFRLLPTATCLFFSQTLKPPSVPWSAPVLYRRLLLLRISKHSLQIWPTLINSAALKSKLPFHSSRAPARMPWWSDNMWSLRKKLKVAYKLSRESPSQGNRDAYSHLKAEYQRTLRAGKK